MKIKRLEIKGYKSIEHLVLEDVPSLMVLAGANGAGKSNLVEALAFFSTVVRDGVNRAVKDFGGLTDILPKVKHIINNIILDITLQNNNNIYEYFLCLNLRENKLEIEKESFSVNGENISTLEPNKGLNVGFSEKMNYSPLLRTVKLPREYEQLIMQSLNNNETTLPDKVKQKMDSIRNKQELFRNLFGNVRIFRIDPFAAKYPSRDINNSDELNPNGNNIAAVLAKLEKDDDFRETLMEWLELIVPQMQEINASANRLDGSVGLSFTEANGKQFPAHLISDGTIYVICILTAILSRYNEYGITIIEEPERGIHPKAIGEIIGFIRDKMAESGKHTVILTTHSESVVRNSEVEELFFVQQENGATQVKSLRDSSVDKNKIPLDTAWLTNILGGGSPW